MLATPEANCKCRYDGIEPPPPPQRSFRLSDLEGSAINLIATCCETMFRSRMVGTAGIEPATSCSQSRRAA